MVYAIVVHGIGLLGGQLARKRGIPAGAFLGSIVFVFAFNLITTVEPDYPPNLRLVIQIFTGIILGAGFTRADLFTLRRLVKPALIIVSMFLAFNALFAVILARFTALEPTTAMLASAPGGIFDMAIIAIEFGADSHDVVLLQLFRFLLTVSIFPIIVMRLLNQKRPEKDPATADANKPALLTTRQKAVRLIFTVLCGAIGSTLFRWLGIPAGGILGSITGAVLLSAGAQKAYFPKRWRPIVQSFAGGFIGTRFSMATIAALGNLVLPMMIIGVQLLVMALTTAWVVQRFTSLDHAHSLFSCVPGGTGEMGMLAGDLGLRVPDIVLLHIVRLISILFMAPLLLSLFFRLGWLTL